MTEENGMESMDLDVIENVKTVCTDVTEVNPKAGSAVEPNDEPTCSAVEPHDVPTCSADGAEVSKRPNKRLLRLQQKREKWEARKPIKRAQEREKMKLKRAEARLNHVTLGPSRKGLKDNKMASSQCKLRVVVDLAFDKLMTDKDVTKCNKQLLRCYSFNRRAENPVQFYITSLSGLSLEKMKKHDGYEHWDVNIHGESFQTLFESEDLVYLTSESDNVITELDEKKVYVIGGLVDHNSHKGLCHQVARDLGIAHGQLPIGEFLQMKSRKVLAVNHVFEILVHVSSGKSWQEAFLAVMPQRKGASAKNHLTDILQTFYSTASSDQASSDQQ